MYSAVSFYQAFVICTEQSGVFNEGSSVSTKGYIIHVFKFMRHIFKHGGCNCSFISLYPCSKFQQSSANVGTQNAGFMYPRRRSQMVLGED
jgi:hypothetical protein